MIIHGNKQISGIIYSRKASDGGGAVALTNIIRGPQVVFGGLFPFSPWLRAAACKAILAAFGQTDGKAVIKATNAYLNALNATDPTKAQALAGFINTYEAEDPHMIYSIVPTLGVLRRIKTDGNAYINTGIYVSMDDTVDAICAYGSVQAMPFGARGNSWGSEAICAASYSGDSPAIVTIGFYDAGGSTTVSSFVVVAGKDIHIVMKGTDNYWKLDGESYGKTAGTSGVTLTRPIYLLAVNRGGSKYDSSQNYFTKFEVVGKHYLIPFIRNNVKGMLDMQTNTFHQNAGSGSFTISETPSTP